MNINLTTYKLFTGKYIIYEEKGKGKEYDGYIDFLQFEREYLNGERNGNWKEYYNGNELTFEYYGHINYLQFEGEYLNGKRNGKGKEYIYDSFFEDLIFEGEY